MIDRLRENGTPWEEIPTHYKRGSVCMRVIKPKFVKFLNASVERKEWECDYEPPIFTQDREYLGCIYRSVDAS